jgi:hypothetical protein
MPGTEAPRLLRKTDLMALLQLPEPQIKWLVDTQQIRTILLCGEERFDSRELDRLIQTYKQIAERKEPRVQ